MEDALLDFLHERGDETVDAPDGEIAIQPDRNLFAEIVRGDRNLDRIGVEVTPQHATEQATTDLVFPAVFLEMKRVGPFDFIFVEKRKKDRGILVE